jgi:two-component system, NtrC family, sensor kinase
MNFDFILLIIIFSYLRKKLQSKILYPLLDRFFVAGFFLSIAFLMIELTVKGSRTYTLWVADLTLIYLIYLSFTRNEFQPVKPLVYAFLPLMILNFILDITRLGGKSFYKTAHNYYEAASVFAVIWMVAMLWINRKQRKALETEQQKALKKEKEFKITEALKASLEVQVTERTAALTRQTEELQHALEELKSTQAQLIQSEKMASLGELTAGIAHEIQNPLNFVNNFSEINTELLEEMKEEMEKGNFIEAKELAVNVIENEQKINHHGKRADAIVKGMLQHSRRSTGVKEPTDINALADEFFRLAYHGLRAKDKSFNATMKTDYDTSLGSVLIIPQDIGRVILNLITNAFYAVAEKKKKLNTEANGFLYEPTVWVATKDLGNRFQIMVKDNGGGIPESAIDKIFQPFFTTKPTGEGTGLGLSMSYDIITKGHGGELKVDTNTAHEMPGDTTGTQFTVTLPK